MDERGNAREGCDEKGGQKRNILWGEGKEAEGGSHQEDEDKCEEICRIVFKVKSEVERENADISGNNGLMKKKRQRTKLSNSIK